MQLEILRTAKRQVESRQGIEKLERTYDALCRKKMYANCYLFLTSVLF